MKRIVAFGLVFAMAMSIPAIAEPAAPNQPAAKDTSKALASKAKVLVDATDFNFGFIPGDSYVSHAYWMQSRGMDSLKILSVRPG